MMGKRFAIPVLFALIGLVSGGLLVYAYYGYNGAQGNTVKEKEAISDSCNIAIEEKPLNEDELNKKSALAYMKFKEIKADFAPAGVPDVYGKELNISFDEVQDAINKVSVFDPTYGQNKIILSGDDLKRYIDIGFMIACEFCCGAKTLVFEDGEAACGCEHSQMMRGLAAYIIKNHSQMTNGQILEELVKWKRVYFPKQTLSAELKKMQDSGAAGIEEILDEFPDFLPEMVGGC